jgi:hypothetical protein
LTAPSTDAQQQRRQDGVPASGSDPLFIDNELQFLQSMDALCADSEGRLVLRGLTREETEAYLRGHRDAMNAPGSVADPEYLRISRKHHKARFEALRPLARTGDR